eukprot:scpid103440/ scgid0048/ 
MEVERIRFDSDLLENTMLPCLQRFYKSWLLPQIAHPQESPMDFGATVTSALASQSTAAPFTPSRSLSAAFVSTSAMVTLSQSTAVPVSHGHLSATAGKKKKKNQPAVAAASISNTPTAPLNLQSDKCSTGCTADYLTYPCSNCPHQFHIRSRKQLAETLQFTGRRLFEKVKSKTKSRIKSKARSKIRSSLLKAMPRVKSTITATAAAS